MYVKYLIFGSKSLADFKRDLIKCTNLEKNFRIKILTYQSSGAKSQQTDSQNMEMMLN